VESLTIKQHRPFISIVIFGILTCVVLYFVIFLILQYRSNGRCIWQSSSSALLVDGNGVIEYSALSDKDRDYDTLFVADDGYYGTPKSDALKLNYGSD